MTVPPPCSRSPARSAGPWPEWIRQARHLVAESLVRVRDPLATWLHPGPPVPPAAVAARLARALLPPEAADRPPVWLRADQRLSFARALAALRRHRGVLLADWVGTGKTYIGLAVAGALEPDRAVHVLAPATLRSQWEDAARRIGIGLRFHSYELLSRGRIPSGAPGPVVLDESHRLRNQATRRYRALAPWCVGRHGILLSATPAVNRLDDVVHQLLLFVREDAFSWNGTASLRDWVRNGRTGALARLVITGEDRSALLPRHRSRDLRVGGEPGSALSALQRGIGSLDLSADPTTASLIRVSLLSALASSPLAIADGLARYLALLKHARDAAACGVALSRTAIRRFAGPEGEQLVFWPLVAESSPTDVAIDDLGPATALEALARRWSQVADAKVRALAATAADGKLTLTFTTSLGTVRYLRRHLGRSIAWCTGAGSGVDGLGLLRDEVLDWFRKPALRATGSVQPPAVLVATDVASEGLDLPLVERVVHYDLPWTAVRLDQRTGRALRLGAIPDSIEVIRFLPPDTLEAALRKEAILEAKRGFPEMLGLGERGNAPWRLRARIAAEWLTESATSGIAALFGGGGDSRVVAGIRMTFLDGGALEFVLVVDSDGWSDEVESIGSLLDLARRGRSAPIPDPISLRPILHRLSQVAKRALRHAQAGRLEAPSGATRARQIRRRLLTLARDAARRRDHSRLGDLEKGLRFLRRGHTAGESALLEEWGGLGLPELLHRLSRLPEEPRPPEVAGIELIGLLVITPERSPR